MSEYTSNLLCHFVGRSRKNDDERFELLKTIVEGKTLIANLTEPTNPQSYFQRGDNCKNLGEVFSKCDCVCFCDIPDHALSIHINKYSSFGLGFNKEFIAQQGARPVMYVPKNYSIIERTDGKKEAQSSSPRNPNEYFPYILSVVCNLPVLMEMCCDPEKLKRNFNDAGLTQFLGLFDSQVKEAFFSHQYHSMTYSLIQGVANQMAYVKLFDAALADDHPDNYYMEREWRCLKNVLFNIEDIECVYLPNGDYKELFKQSFPTYSGRFFIFDEKQ